MPKHDPLEAGASIGGLTTQLRHGPKVAARARQGFERSLQRKARAEIDPDNHLSEDEFVWRYQRWRSLYFKRLRAVGTRKQHLNSAREGSSS
jgi:hypothetical protein